MIEHLPLQIASGILVAAVVLLLARVAFALWQRERHEAATLCGFFSALFGLSLILAGLGIVPF